MANLFMITQMLKRQTHSRVYGVHPNQIEHFSCMLIHGVKCLVMECYGRYQAKLQEVRKTYRFTKYRTQWNGQMVSMNKNVNVHVYSPDIPVASADCTTYTPGIETHSFTVSSPLGRIQHLRTLLQL